MPKCTRKAVRVSDDNVAAQLRLRPASARSHCHSDCGAAARVERAACHVAAATAGLMPILTATSATDRNDLYAGHIRGNDERPGGREDLRTAAANRCN